MEWLQKQDVRRILPQKPHELGDKRYERCSYTQNLLTREGPELEPAALGECLRYLQGCWIKGKSNHSLCNIVLWESADAYVLDKATSSQGKKVMSMRHL